MSGQMRLEREHGGLLRDDVDELLGPDPGTSLGAFLARLRLDARVDAGQVRQRAQELALIARWSATPSSSEAGFETTDLIVDLNEIVVGNRTDSVEEVRAGSTRMPGAAAIPQVGDPTGSPGRSHPDVGGTHSEVHENTARV